MITVNELYKRFLESSGACTDTRSIAPDSMFFALKGPNFNANAFAAEALGKGARWAVVDEEAAVKDDRCLLVQDSLAALQSLATFHRRQFDIPVIAITGSNGKTTTKELVHAVLSSDRPTLATIGNLNNHIGVPLTLLRLQQEHRVAIIEMGANKPGDIDELVRIAEPTLGLITNIGKAHLEGFGGFEGVLRTKTELYRDLQRRDGCVFVNADDELLMEQSSGIKRRTYGKADDADYRGRSIGDQASLTVAFDGNDGKERTASMRLIGAYNLPNALAAIAIGRYLKVPDERIAQALEAYEPGNNRSQFTDTGRNQLILDAYNANPTSMSIALENFARMSSDRPKLAILGDMLELGDAASVEHEAVVELLGRLGIEGWYVGPLFSTAAHGGRCWPDVVALVADLRSTPLKDRLILIKGSRGIRLEQVVSVL